MKHLQSVMLYFSCSEEEARQWLLSSHDKAVLFDYGTINIPNTRLWDEREERHKLSAQVSMVFLSPRYISVSQSKPLGFWTRVKSFLVSLPKAAAWAMTR